jgi:hypothetical protein
MDSSMSLHEDLEYTLKEKLHKRRVGRIVVWGFMILLLILAMARAIVLIYYPASWLGKHIFKW